jgi:hypothetical protein
MTQCGIIGNCQILKLKSVLKGRLNFKYGLAAREPYVQVIMNFDLQEQYIS